MVDDVSAILTVAKISQVVSGFNTEGKDQQIREYYIKEFHIDGKIILFSPIFTADKVGFYVVLATRNLASRVDKIKVRDFLLKLYEIFIESAVSIASLPTYVRENISILLPEGKQLNYLMRTTDVAKQILTKYNRNIALSLSQEFSLKKMINFPTESLVTTMKKKVETALQKINPPLDKDVEENVRRSYGKYIDDLYNILSKDIDISPLNK